MIKSPSDSRPDPILLIIGIPASVFGLIMFALGFGSPEPLLGMVVLFAVIVVLAGSIYLLIQIKKRSNDIDPLVPILVVICIWIAFGVGTIVHLFKDGWMMPAFLSVIGCIMVYTGSMFIKLHFKELRNQAWGDPLKFSNKQVKIEEWIVGRGLIFSIIGFLILGYSLMIDAFIFGVLLSMFLIGLGAVAFVLGGVFTLIRGWWLKSGSVK